jgi:hypothetical protein
MDKLQGKNNTEDIKVHAHLHINIASFDHVHSITTTDYWHYFQLNVLICSFLSFVYSAELNHIDTYSTSIRGEREREEK